MTFPFPLFAKFSALKIAFYMAIILIIIGLINYNRNWFNKSQTYEGFTQDKPFVLKQNNDIYDEFYIEIYDKLNSTIKRTEYDTKQIMETVNKETANILDVGCGTGYLVNEFIKNGIEITGIDKSQYMINYATNIHTPLLQNKKSVYYQCLEGEDPTIYQMSSFSHILCLYMTIYEMKDKLKFFRNAFYGLQQNGYLVVHLIKGENDYNGFIDLGKPKAIDEKTIMESGIKKLETDFGGFLYKRDWSNIYNFKESFTDHKTHNVRQNELSWFYEPVDVIIEQTKRCGFNIYKIVPEYKNIGGGGGGGGGVGGDLYFFRKPGINKK